MSRNKSPILENVDGHEMCRSEIDELRRLVQAQLIIMEKLIRGECVGTVGTSFVACGEDPEGYGYCSHVCRLRAERRIT